MRKTSINKFKSRFPTPGPYVCFQMHAMKGERKEAKQIKVNMNV